MSAAASYPHILIAEDGTTRIGRSRYKIDHLAAEHYQVVCGVRRSVNAAYLGWMAEIPVTVQALYDKLKGLEPGTTAELVRYSAREAQAVIEQMGGQREALLVGYRVTILDGNCLGASEHRIKELRELGGGRCRVNRWRIETAFFHLAEDLNCELNTVGYPRAALFGFGIGLVAYNTLAVLKAALRVKHGASTVDEELSGYYLADESAAPIAA